MRAPVVLVPLDGSPASECALPWAAAFAEALGGKLHLVHAQRGLPPATGDTSARDRLRLDLALRRASRDYLRRTAAATATARGLKVTSALLREPAARAIAEAVQSAGADLVVMTTHGRGGLTRFWLGSVADQVARSLPVPLVLLRPADDARPAETVAVRRILVPLDGSPLAESALTRAVDLARRFGAEVLVARVVAPVFMATALEAPQAAGRDVELTDRMLKDAQEYIGEVVAWLRAQQLEAVGLTTVSSNTADALLTAAAEQHADLIALTTHGRGGLRRLVLGSVADKIVRASGLPVYLTRPSGRARKRAR